MATISRDILGKTIKIDVDDTSGLFKFYGHDIDQSLKFDTDASLPKLVERIRRQMIKGKIKAKLRVGVIEYGVARNVTVTHLTKDAREVNIVYDDGTKSEIRAHDTAYDLFTPETIAQLKQLVEADRAAAQALDDFKRAHQLVKGTKSSYANSSLSDVLGTELKRLADERAAKEAATTLAAVPDPEPQGYM